MGKREKPYARVSRTPLASAVRWALVAATLAGSTNAFGQTAEPAAPATPAVPPAK